MSEMLKCHLSPYYDCQRYRSYCCNISAWNYNVVLNRGVLNSARILSLVLLFPIMLLPLLFITAFQPPLLSSFIRSLALPLRYVHTISNNGVDNEPSCAASAYLYMSAPRPPWSNVLMRFCTHINICILAWSFSLIEVLHQVAGG